MTEATASNISAVPAAEATSPALVSAIPAPEADAHRGRLFPEAPPSIVSFIASLLEPAVTLLCFLLVSLWRGDALERPALVLCMLVIVLTFPGVNRFLQRSSVAAADILREWLAVLAILMLFGYATDSFGFFERNTLIAWAVLTPLLQWGSVHAGKHVMQRVAAQPQYRRQTIVIGAGDNAARLAESLRSQKEVMHDLRGFFDDRSGSRIHADTSAKRLGGFDDVVEFVKRNSVRNVYITLPLTSQRRIVELLSKLQDTTTSVYYVPDVFGVSMIQGQLQNVGGTPIVTLLETPFTGTNHLIKRATDIVFSLIAIALLSPVLLGVAIGVKRSSPGPIIFKQRRTGLDGEEILVYKFRSMVTQDNGAVVKQATRGDSRITPFGAFIRKTSLDELPQLFNVLFGTMSLVGPRPHAVAHNEHYRGVVQAYMVRHKVRPGITGWAQVNGFRGETETVDKMAARVHYDLEYLRNWSLALDFKIIARTVRVLFFDRNAY